MNMPSIEQVIPIVRQAGATLVERSGARIFKTKGASDFLTEVDLRLSFCKHFF